MLKLIFKKYKKLNDYIRMMSHEIENTNKKREITEKITK